MNSKIYCKDTYKDTSTALQKIFHKTQPPSVNLQSMNDKTNNGKIKLYINKYYTINCQKKQKNPKNKPLVDKLCKIR